ncbi:hypothetical protein NKJ75_32545, partial [Mesorhizobium sp. M0058]
MKRRAFILVEGHARGNGLRYVKAAKRLGLHPITVSAESAKYDHLSADEGETLHVDTDDLDALIREFSRLGETHEIAGITGF